MKASGQEDNPDAAQLLNLLLLSCRVGLAHASDSVPDGSARCEETIVQSATISLTALRQLLETALTALEYRTICAIAVHVFAKGAK